ncbi:MAG: ROK family protein [Devosia sp.]
MRSVADADFVRRQNRGLVLSTLRRHGPLSRTRLAGATGLSHASITGISGELIGQSILVEGEPQAPAGARGRPPVEVAFNRHACYAVIVELDVNRARCSLVDYAGTIVDRTEISLAPNQFSQVKPADFIIERIEQLRQRNVAEQTSIRSIAISVQGILDPTGDTLTWSPIAHMNGQSVAAPVRERFGAPTTLHKRGRLLAQGTRLLYPELGETPIAAVFIGSTVAMGLSIPARGGHPEAGATEFGHMNHLPDGALCRCGMKGCIEAYAADYGVLRTAYGVPDRVPPAALVPAAAYQELVNLAKTGRRNALHAFNIAGRAIGFGLSRLLTIASPSHIILTGPGASAYELMQSSIEAALRESLVCKVNGPPAIMVHHDEREPIFQGLLMDVLETLDQTVFATMASEPRLSRA